MTTWSPELELMARLSRVAPTVDDEGRARELSDRAVDWDRFLRLVRHHEVAPLAHASLARAPFPGVPVHVRGALRDLRLSSTRGDLALYQAWLQLCAAFEAHGIRALTLKGFHVVLSIYGQVGLRPVGDLDFLVRRQDVRASLALLETVGYRPFPDWQAAIAHVGLDHILRATHEIGLVGDHGTVVDLHWEAGPQRSTPPAEELMAGAERLDVAGQCVLVPPRDAAMALLLLHGHASAWARLRWLVDVAEGIDRLSPAEFERVRQRLDALGMRAAWANALALADAMWGRPPAPGGARVPHERAVQPLTLRYCARAIEREQDWPHVFDLWRPVRMLWDRAGRARSLPAAASAALAPNYFDWAAVALPPPLRFGYYVVRPARVVGQAVARRRPVRPREAAPRRRAHRRPAVPLTFVTAIYDSDHSTLLGGRGRGLAHYLSSLINIANLGAPIVVYCAPRDVAAVSDALAPHFAEYRVVAFGLNRFEHFDAFLRWKEAYWRELPVNDRNEVLCFLKSYWVQDAIAANHFRHDRYFWIDAGLTHHGIFPEGVGGVELLTSPPAAHYYPHNAANIFTPRLGAALARSATRGKLFFCAHPLAANHPRRPTYEAIAARTFGRAAETVRMDAHLVGGLFGGYADDLRAVHRLYAHLLGEFIRTRTYTLEEQVFSAVRAAHPEMFALQRFTTWYYYAPGERVSQLEADGDSFYKIFTGLAQA